VERVVLRGTFRERQARGIESPGLPAGNIGRFPGPRAGPAFQIIMRSNPGPVQPAQAPPVPVPRCRPTRPPLVARPARDPWRLRFADHRDPSCPGCPPRPSSGIPSASSLPGSTSGVFIDMVGFFGCGVLWWFPAWNAAGVGCCGGSLRGTPRVWGVVVVPCVERRGCGVLWWFPAWNAAGVDSPCRRSGTGHIGSLFVPPRGLSSMPGPFSAR
jgi:hypothetical protein